MDKNKFKNSLTGTPIINKPNVGFGRKLIIDASGYIIGSVSGNKIFDLNGRLWGRVVTKNEATGFNKNEIVDRGSVVATLDSKNNIYRRVIAQYSQGTSTTAYIGTIRSNKIASVIMPLLIIALVITVTTSVILASILKDKSEPDYLKNAPIIDVFSKTNSVSWLQDDTIDIFPKTVIAPGDSGEYPFVIKNKDLHPIDYTINFSENNEHEFPLKFRLYYRTYYIGGTSAWHSLSEISKHTQELQAGQTDTYILEWWWDPNVSDEIDTDIGEHQYRYEIDISISASFVTRGQ